MLLNKAKIVKRKMLFFQVISEMEKIDEPFY